MGQHIDLEKALNIIAEPKLGIVSYTLTDTIDGDRDGRPDAGETIELKVNVRNTWGQANDVNVGLEFGEFEDHSTATILTSEANIGSVSAYSTKENTISLKLKLAANINDGRDIVFKLKTWYSDNLGEMDQPIVINVENGFELKGIISKDMVLYPSKQYIIVNNIVIPQGVTLTIKAGTTLKFGESKSMVVAGKIIAVGKPDSIITFTKRDTNIGWAGIVLEDNSSFEASYCIYEYSGFKINGDKYIFQDFGSPSIINNCIFRYNGSPQYLNYGIYFSYRSNIQNNCFYDNIFERYGIFNGSSTNTFSFNNLICNTSINSVPEYGCALFYFDYSKSFHMNNIFSNNNNKLNKELNISAGFGDFKIINLDSLYFGTMNENKINNGILDFQEKGTGYWFDISKKMKRPSKESHGIVWKVVVNGKDAQDEFDQLDPLGVGKQKMEVYFNRAMDINAPPTVSMGVRYPYSQTAMAEDGSWSSDSTIYTVYGTIGLSTGDGINTIRVTGAKDMDHFEIPIEDRRFRVVVNAAGSLSEGFEANPGMGSVVLKWEKPDASVSDLMGYNLYRYSYLNDSVTTDTVLVNSNLIADTEYNDFDVQPATKYFYAYKTVRTNLTESNFSKVVAAIPLTVSQGDANGDLNVNTLDISSVVSYSLNENPQLFIFRAADMNNDKLINVLDVVKLANVIYKPIITEPGATIKLINLYLKNDTLFMDAPKAVAALQFDFSGIQTMDEIQKLPALDGFESAYSKDGETFRFITYSLSSKSIPSGNHIPLLKLKKGSGLLTTMFSDAAGNQIKSKFIPTGLWNFRDNLDQRTAELGQNYPNPLSKTTTIPLKIYEPVDEAVIRVINTQGQEIAVIRLKSPELGEHQITWNAGNNKGLVAYFLEIRRGNQQFLIDVKKMIVQ